MKKITFLFLLTILNMNVFAQDPIGVTLDITNKADFQINGETELTFKPGDVITANITYELGSTNGMPNTLNFLFFRIEDAISIPLNKGAGPDPGAEASFFSAGTESGGVWSTSVTYTIDGAGTTVLPLTSADPSVGYRINAYLSYHKGDGSGTLFGGFGGTDLPNVFIRSQAEIDALVATPSVTIDTAPTSLMQGENFTMEGSFDAVSPDTVEGNFGFILRLYNTITNNFITQIVFGSVDKNGVSAESNVTSLNMVVPSGLTPSSQLAANTEYRLVASIKRTIAQDFIGAQQVVTITEGPNIKYTSVPTEVSSIVGAGYGKGALKTIVTWSNMTSTGTMFNQLRDHNGDQVGGLGIAVNTANGSAEIAWGYFGTGTLVSGNIANIYSQFAGINIEQTNIPVINTITRWSGGGGTDWDTAGSWDNGVPTATLKAVIPNVVSKPIISTSADALNVTVQENSSLTIDSGKSLTVAGNFITNDNVILESTSLLYSSLILNGAGTVSGTVNYKRFTSLLGTNDLISAPVTGQTFGSFESNTENSNLADSGTIRAFAIFDNTVNTVDDPNGKYINYDTGTNASTLITAGTGYRAATTPVGTLTFTGTVNTGTVSAPIAIGAGSQWNLIGNPYPSYIKVNDGTDGFLNNTTNGTSMDVNNVGIYGYDANPAGTGGIWTIYNLANTDATTLIAPGQGFFVAASGTGNIEFTSNMTTIGVTDDFIAGRGVASKTTVSKAHSMIQLSNATETYQTDIYFIDGQTKSLDPGYDAGAFQGNASGIFTNLVEGNTGVEMAIQALDYNDFNDVIVPLGIKAEAGVQLSVGIDEASTLPSNINVYLEDNIANTLTLLNSGDYSFAPSSELSGTGRFFLHFTSTTLSTDDNKINGLHIYASSSAKALFVKGQLTNNSAVNLYDLQGRLVLSENLDPTSNSNKIDVSTLSTGIYVVKVNNGNQFKTQKVIIK